MFNNYKKFNKMTKRKMAMHDQTPHLEAMHWGYIRAFCEAVNETALALMNQLCLEETSAKFDDLVSKSYHEWKSEHALDGVSLDYDTFLKEYRLAVAKQIMKDLTRE